MSDTTISPNMSLPVPTVGVDTGPDWANNLNACLSIIDQHDHTSGYGVPIPPAGININSDLTFHGNSAISLKSVVFTAQASVTTTDAIYVKGVDLYYRDGSNNEVRMTSGGSVNATSSGISDGTATAAFVGGVLVVNSASVTPANIQCGSILLGNNVANSKYLTLAPPNAMAANYGLVLPSIPASQKIMTLDASGNMSAPYTVDGTTIAISANVLGIPNLAIGTAQIAASAVTPAKIDATGSFTMSALTATTLIGGNVAANNQLRFQGHDALVSQTNNSTTLSVIRGYLQANGGGIYNGSGFTQSTNLAAGRVAITYTSGFSDVPAVTVQPAGPLGTSYQWIVSNASTSSGFTVQFFDSAGATLSGSTPEFYFHAIGLYS